jgi:hypothetical protein
MARSSMSDDFNDNDDIGYSTDDSIDNSGFTLDTDAAELASTQEDAPEARSVTSRCRIREQLEQDIQAYLQHGGSIHHIEQGTLPPPSTRYQDDYWNPLL